MRAFSSLLITGIAEVFAAARDGVRRGGERWGLVLMVVSAAAFALMAAVVKKLLPDAPAQAVVLSRGLIMTAVFVGMARWQRAPLLGRQPVVLLLRGLLGYAALSCYFWSVQHLPLGDAVLLQYSHPIFVAAVAPLVLGEATRPLHWFLIVAALFGIALIVGPSGDLRGSALVGVLGSLMSGLAYLTVRRLSKTDHPATILVWFPLSTLPLSAIATVAAGESALPRNGREVAGHLLVAASALVGQVTLTHGLARAGAARATAVTLTGPVFGMALGYAMFGSIPSATSFAGMAIVLTSLAWLGWTTVSASPADRGSPSGRPPTEREAGEEQPLPSS